MGINPLFTDATADLSDCLLLEIPPVEIIPMQVAIGGAEYTYAPAGTISVKEFYQL